MLDYVVLADVISPRPDGKLDFHGVGWDTVFAHSVPAMHPRMDVGVRFLLSAHELESGHRVVASLQEADGAELARLAADVEPMPEVQRQALPAGRRAGIGLILNFVNVVFPRYGAYQLSITWDGNEAREPLRLFVAEPPAPEA